MTEQIEKLQERLRNKKERWDVEIQVEYKTKNKGCQTIQTQMGKDREGLAGATSFGQMSDGGEHFVDHQTVVSTTNMTTQMNHTGRPRVQSASREPDMPNQSELDSNIDPAQDIGNGGMIQRPTKSAVNKYRNMISGNAIAEEIDYN